MDRAPRHSQGKHVTFWSEENKIEQVAAHRVVINHRRCRRRRGPVRDERVHRMLVDVEENELETH